MANNCFVVFLASCVLSISQFPFLGNVMKEELQKQWKKHLYSAPSFTHSIRLIVAVRGFHEQKVGDIKGLVSDSGQDQREDKGRRWSWKDIHVSGPALPRNAVLTWGHRLLSISPDWAQASHP